MALLDVGVEDRVKAAAKTLSRIGNVRAIYIFGSQVDGGTDRWSDIDVAVFMEEVENWDIHQRARVMALVMEEAGSNVETHLFPISSFDNPMRGSFAEYIIQHGVRVMES